MSNELKPCPIHIGDKITIHNRNHDFLEFGVKIVTGIYFEHPDKYMIVWCDYIDEKGQTRGEGEDCIDYVKLHERRPLCPDALEAAAKDLEEMRVEMLERGVFGWPNIVKDVIEIIRNERGEA